MKGYNLSNDYSKLWDLIHDGYRIPAWILYSDKYTSSMYDIVEVKMPKLTKFPSIGTRDKGYETFESTKQAFIDNCKALELSYIIPNH